MNTSIMPKNAPAVKTQGAKKAGDLPVPSSPVLPAWVREFGQYVFWFAYQGSPSTTRIQRWAATDPADHTYDLVAGHPCPCPSRKRTPHCKHEQMRDAVRRFFLCATPGCYFLNSISTDFRLEAHGPFCVLVCTRCQCETVLDDCDVPLVSALLDSARRFDPFWKGGAA